MPHRLISTGLVLLGLLGITAVVSPGIAATSPIQSFGPAKRFKIAEPYEPPDEMQTKSLLEGGKALPMTGGKILLSDGVILRMFSKTNTLQLVVTAQECVYNSTLHCVDSAGPIKMQTADGKFTIEGIGFFLQQSNSSVVISNNVRTTIQAALFQATSSNGTESAGGSDTGPLFISSEQFSYDGTSGLGIWSNNVHVTGTNLVLDSSALTAAVPVKERQLHSLLAEGRVVVLYSGLHAMGDRLNYAPDTGLIRLTEHATWQAVEVKPGAEKRTVPESDALAQAQRQGGGDELVIDRTNRIFQVNGHAWLRLPGQPLGESGFLALSNAPTRTPNNSTKGSVEIACDHYEIRTNWATFHDHVRLDEHRDQLGGGHLTCEAMTVTFAGTNELQTMTADKDVVIEEGDKKFTGGRAFYTVTNTTLEITQKPTWRAGPPEKLREGKGDLLRLNTQQNELLMRGNASLHLPANELAGQFSPTPLTGTTNRPARSGTNQFADIFCQEYTLRPDTSVFQGGVYATHPEMNWSCEKLTVKTPVAGTTNLVAEQNVVFELMTQKGKVQGNGDQAVYSFGVLNTITNGLLAINELRLTGAPAVVSNIVPGMVSQNNLIIWDRTKNKISLPGTDYRMQGVVKATSINIFLLPNNKPRK